MKKRVNGAWVEKSPPKYNTSTDTITSLPADLYADGTDASVGLKGNMSQSGTPSPTTPIQPQECGERTGNLFDRSTEQVGYFVNENGTLSGNQPTWIASDYVEISENTEYTFVPNSTRGAAAKHCFYNKNKQPFVSAVIDSGQQTFTTPVGAKYVRFSYRTSSSNITLNTGSTPLPYEPFGVKIPISSGNTTTPVYLGEVESTRKIAKYEFTGQEDDTILKMQSSGLFYLKIVSEIGYENGRAISSHYINQQVANVSMTDLRIKQDVSTSAFGSRSGVIVIKHTDYTTLTDFKTYLQQQYSAGTPVTVWYVLATPTTGIVNEPLRKIGEYADTVSGITIPTIAGSNTIDVNTTLKPSEVSLAYTGWHDASAKEWDGSEWQ